MKLSFETFFLLLGSAAVSNADFNGLCRLSRSTNTAHRSPSDVSGGITTKTRKLQLTELVIVGRSDLLVEACQVLVTKMAIAR